MRRRLVAGVAAVAVVVGAGYWMSVGRHQAAPLQPEHLEADLRPAVTITIQAEPMPVAQQLAGQTGVVHMTVTDHGFEPRVLAAPIGGAVKVHLRNTGSQPHNFMLPRFGIVTQSLAPGAENYIEFPASQKGDWAFFSDSPGQEEPGLAGSLKVE
jgi:uncharacterized cupredoxin-like copper-binding protein